jgi:hypothetical protein
VAPLGQQTLSMQVVVPDVLGEVIIRATARRSQGQHTVSRRKTEVAR